MLVQINSKRAFFHWSLNAEEASGDADERRETVIEKAEGVDPRAQRRNFVSDDHFVHEYRWSWVSSKEGRDAAVLRCEEQEEHALDEIEVRTSTKRLECGGSMKGSNCRSIHRFNASTLMQQSGQTY